MTLCIDLEYVTPDEQAIYSSLYATHRFTSGLFKHCALSQGYGYSRYSICKSKRREFMDDTLGGCYWLKGNVYFYSDPI